MSIPVPSGTGLADKCFRLESACMQENRPMSCRKTARCREGIFRNLHFVPTAHPRRPKSVREKTPVFAPRSQSESRLDGRDVAVD